MQHPIYATEDQASNVWQSMPEFLDCVENGLLVVDTDGNIKLINTFAATLLQIDQCSSVGRPLVDVVHLYTALDASEPVDLLGEADRRAGEPSATNAPKPAKLLFYCDGPLPRRFKVASRRLHSQSTELPSPVVLTIHDVTETEMNREDLHFMRFAFDHAADAIFWANSDKQFVYVNNAAAKQLGYTRKELLQMSIPDISVQHDPELFAQRWDVLKNTHHVQYESLHRHKSGNLIPVEINLTLMQYYNRSFACGMVHDMTKCERAESELKRFRAALDVSPDATLLIDREQMRFIDLNETACVSMGYSREELLAMGPHEIKPVLNETELMQKFDKIIESQDGGGNFETEHRRKDGSIFPVAIFLKSLTTGGRTILVESVHDLTERKKSDAELASLHQQLVETARLAGKAEVATNVLHNVGNVLNSVNVSAGLIQDQINRSGISNFTKAVGVIEQHLDDIGDYVTQDERGKHLPRFLIALNQQMIEEEKLVLEEFDSLISNVSHINAIVSTQQAHARGGGALVEEVSLAELLEKAIHINAASIQQHSVQIVRQFDEIGPVLVDKQKILQVVVNLISNAKNACVEGGKEDRKITVRLRRVGENRVLLEVQDNGMGIAKKNLTRIFAHGFTTRVEGHGFGLHSAALAVKELGGVLAVHSDGPGLGATFTIEMPYILAGFSAST